MANLISASSEFSSGNSSGSHTKPEAWQLQMKNVTTHLMMSHLTTTWPTYLPYSMLLCSSLQVCWCESVVQRQVAIDGEDRTVGFPGRLPHVPVGPRKWTRTASMEEGSKERACGWTVCHLMCCTIHMVLRASLRCTISAYSPPFFRTLESQ